MFRTRRVHSNVFARGLRKGRLIAQFMVLRKLILTLQVRMDNRSFFNRSRYCKFTNMRVGNARTRMDGLQASAGHDVKERNPKHDNPNWRVNVTPSNRFGAQVRRLRLYDRHNILRIAMTSKLIRLVQARSNSNYQEVKLSNVTFVRGIFLMGLFRRPPRNLSMFIIMNSVQVFRIRPVPRLITRINPLFHVRRRVNTTFAIVFLSEGNLTGVFLNGTRFFFRARFRQGTINVPANLTLRRRALRNLRSTRNVFSKAYRRIVSTKVPINQQKAFGRGREEASFAFNRAFVGGIYIVPIFRGVLIRLKRIRLYTFHRFVDRCHLSFA